jgi:hypothetical protein
MYCNHCGQELPDQSQFCSYCGQKFISPTAAPYSPAGVPTSKMASHLQVAAWGNIVFGSIGILVGLVVFGFFSLLGVGIPYLNRMNHEFNHFPFGIFFPGIGILILGFFTLISLPQLVGGIGLLKQCGWARILVIIVSIFGLFSFPFGTILGAYSLWILLSRGGEELFHQQR